MFKLVIYQIPSGRFRWRLMRGVRCVGRADYHWATRSAAKNAFLSIKEGLAKEEYITIVDE